MTRKYNPRFGGAITQLELTRPRLEEPTSELLDRTMDITARTLVTAKHKSVRSWTTCS